MRVETTHIPYISSGTRYALLNAKNPFDTGGLENMSQADIARHANVRFTSNYGAPTYQVAQQASGEIYGGWKVENHGLKKANFPFIKFNRVPPRDESPSVGDKFHISVAPKDLPKAFEIISRLINSEESPINSWKTSDLDRIKGERLSLGGQFTLYPKPDRSDGTYSPEYMGKIQALIKTIEQELHAEGVQPSDHKPDSDVAAPEWGYVSYRNEIRSDRHGSEEQSALLRNEPFFKLIGATA